jgi:hypothetical protein
MPIRPVYLVIALLLVLTPPVLLSILREGKIISIPLFFQYMKGGIFYRTFIMPMEVGLYHVYHAQIHGYFGIAAIPKIATLLGIQPINVANLIYRNYLYYSITLPTGLANSSYVLSYYSYFGILSVIGSLFCLWLLDFSIVLFKRIKNDMILVACLSSILPISISFVSIDFTIALVTNGFLLLLFVVWMLDKMNDYFSKNEI